MTTTATMIVMMAVATGRRPPTRPCTHNSNGHVATTIVAAHTSAAMNGDSVHKLPTMSIAITITTSVTRATSVDVGATDTELLNAEETATDCGFILHLHL